jgi:hypothetical protein
VLVLRFASAVMLCELRVNFSRPNFLKTRAVFIDRVIQKNGVYCFRKCGARELATSLTSLQRLYIRRQHTSSNPKTQQLKLARDLRQPKIRKATVSFTAERTAKDKSFCLRVAGSTAYICTPRSYAGDARSCIHSLAVL